MSTVVMITLGVVVFLIAGWIGARTAVNKFIPP